MPKDNGPKLTRAEAVEVYKSLTPRQKELHYLLSLEELTPEQREEAERLIQEGMAAGTEAKAAAERATRRAESELKPGIADLSGTRTLTRMPSSDWDYKFMLAQAGRSAEQGAKKVINVLHVPRRTLLLGKRSPGWTELPQVQYPGEWYFVMKSPDGSQVLFQHFTSNAGPTEMNTFDELNPKHRKLVLKTVPKIRKLQQNGWDLKKMKTEFPISNNIHDGTGRYYIKDRGPLSILVRSRGGKFQFGYLKMGFLGPSTKWASYPNLPSHIRSYLKLYSEAPRNVPWASIAHASRKRSLFSASSSSGYEHVGARNDINIHYPGEEVVILDTQQGHKFDFPNAAQAYETTTLKPYQALTEEEQHLVHQAIPKYQQYKNGEITLEGVGIDFKLDPIYQKIARVQIPGREAETIRPFLPPLYVLL
ncbi:hypothetical protein NDA16_000989 [Ustilago loliicola]|nr:hypothetical protein NDA16_000989 [Ustilago loliicola]